MHRPGEMPSGPLADFTVYSNGAFIQHYMVGDRVTSRAVWDLGNFTLTSEALDLASRSSRHRIPLRDIQFVGPPPKTMLPPPASMEQVLALHFTSGGQSCVTMIAFPAVTVRNFPMQLAAALTGRITAYVPQLGGAGAVRYDPVAFQFVNDRLEISGAGHTRSVPLDTISTLQCGKRRDTQGREFVEWTVQHVADQGLVSLNLVAYERAQFLYPLLLSIQGLRKHAALGRDARPSENLSEAAQQVAVMLYTGGVTAGQLEQMLGLSPEKLDAVYEEILRLGLADVVRVRKEIALNPAGMRAVDEIMKKQLESPTL